MKQIMYNLSLYFSFLKNSLKEILIYRIDCIVGVISELIVQLVSIIFVLIAFNNTENISGITRISIGFVAFCFDSMYEIGPKYIRNGEFDKILLRPVHPLISIIGSSRDFAGITDLFLGIGITISMLQKLNIQITIILIAKIMIFSIIGALIIGALMTIFSIASFFFFLSNEIIWSFYRIHTLTEYPISIYNKFIQIILTYILPFAFVAYYPTMCYLGLNTYMIYLSPIVAILLWIIAVKLWNLALNKYRSTGN